jgi:predicted outer membrane repeat protein
VLWSEADAVVISGVTLRNGRSIDGAGVTNFRNLILDNCRITGNISTQRAGGIWNQGNLTVNNCLIADNMAETSAGGGIYQFSGELNLIDSVVRDNSAGGQGGGIYVSQGGASIVSSTITANQSHSSGVGGGGIMLITTSPVTITDSTVHGNHAVASGGGLGVFATPVSISNSTISGNSAGSHSGGGMQVGGAAVVVLNNVTVTGNSAGASADAARTRCRPPARPASFSTVTWRHADGTAGRHAGEVVT